MKLKKFIFLNFVFCLELYVPLLASSNNEIATTISTAEIQLYQVEKDLIRQQDLTRGSTVQALATTKKTKCALKSNINLIKVTNALDTLANVLSTIRNAKNFTMNNFKKLNKSCKAINTIIGKLETDVELYLRVKSESETGIYFLVNATIDLKLEYFANFIFFNKTESDNVLSVIALNEKQIEKQAMWVASLNATCYQVASILYDVKVTKYKVCEKAKSQQAAKHSTIKTTRSAAKAKTTNRMATGWKWGS